MWPFNKIKITNASEVGDYRIAPQYSGGFEVQMLDLSYDGKRLVWANANAHASYYEKTFFETEKAAEMYIARKLGERQAAVETRQKVKEFYANNPPREVPPYKHI